jgi:hypothetical protein
VNTRIEPKKRVKREQELVEADLRVHQDRVGLVVERAVAIVTQIPLIRSTAAVFDHQLRPAVRAIEAITPANLCQQIRGPTLRDERLQWDHASLGGAAAPPLHAVTSGYCSNSSTIRYRRAMIIRLLERTS